MNDEIRDHIDVRGQCPMHADAEHAIALEQRGPNPRALGLANIDAKKAHKMVVYQ